MSEKSGISPLDNHHRIIQSDSLGVTIIICRYIHWTSVNINDTAGSLRFYENRLQFLPLYTCFPAEFPTQIYGMKNI